MFAKKWGWWPWLHRLTGGDITKLDAILKIPHGTVYMWLALEIDQNTLENNGKK